MPNVAEVIAANVRRLREDEGLTQDELARATQLCGLGWTRSAIAFLESGQREPRVSELIVIAAALDVPPAELLRNRARRVDLTESSSASGDDMYRLLPRRRVHVDWPSPLRKMPTLQFDVRRVNDGLRRLKQVVPNATAGTHVAVERMANEEAVKHLAGTLGLRPFDVAALSWRLWRRSLSEVRDEEAGSGANAMTKAHVTRRLKEEIADAARSVGWLTE
jgi:transcriptional regulator with XRE-family HTH domain